MILTPNKSTIGYGRICENDGTEIFLRKSTSSKTPLVEKTLCESKFSTKIIFDVSYFRGKIMSFAEDYFIFWFSMKKFFAEGIFRRKISVPKRYVFWLSDVIRGLSRSDLLAWLMFGWGLARCVKWTRPRNIQNLFLSPPLFPILFGFCLRPALSVSSTVWLYLFAVSRTEGTK